MLCVSLDSESDGGLILCLGPRHPPGPV